MQSTVDDTVLVVLVADEAVGLDVTLVEDDAFAAIGVAEVGLFSTGVGFAGAKPTSR